MVSRTTSDVVSARLQRAVELLLREGDALLVLRENLVRAHLGVGRRKHDKRAALLLDDAKALDFAKLRERANTNTES